MLEACNHDSRGLATGILTPPVRSHRQQNFIYHKDFQ
jgi:hypothetical protein